MLRECRECNIVGVEKIRIRIHTDIGCEAAGHLRPVHGNLPP